MLCITCGSELPEGAQVCPECGRARLELPVSSADFSEPPEPRRRHGFGKALVIVLLLLVAAAGAAHVLRGNLLSSTPPPPAVHATTSIKAPVPTQDATTSREPVAAGDAPATPSSLRLYLEPYNGATPNGQSGLDATRAAIADLQDQGQDVAETDDPASADHTVHFVEDWHGAPDHVGDTIPVGLGDAQCDGAWTAYRASTMQALAEQGMARALGQELPDPPLLHDGPCQAAHGHLSVASDGTDGKAFRLKSDETVTYRVQEAQGHLIDACLVAQSDWDSFASGWGNGQACQSSVSDGSATADLAAGDYVLGIRCDEAYGSCDVDYTLSLDEPADAN